MINFLKDLITYFYTLLKNVILEILSILKLITEHVIPLVQKILTLCLKNILIILIISSSGFLLIYCIAPELCYWILNKLGISINDLQTYQQMEENTKQILELKQKLVKLESEKTKLNKDLQISLGRNKGILEGINQITLEKVNWWNVILTVSGITIVGGCIVYFFISGSDGDFFKPVVNLMNKNSATIIKGVTKTTTVINDNVAVIVKKLEEIDSKIDAIKNVVDALTPRKPK